MTRALHVPDRTQALIRTPTDPNRRLQRGGPQPDAPSTRTQWSGLAAVLLVLAVIFTWKPVARSVAPAPTFSRAAPSPASPLSRNAFMVMTAPIGRISYAPPSFFANARLDPSASSLVQVPPAVPLPADSDTFRLLR